VPIATKSRCGAQTPSGMVTPTESRCNVNKDTSPQGFAQLTVGKRTVNFISTSNPLRLEGVNVYALPSWSTNEIIVSDAASHAEMRRIIADVFCHLRGTYDGAVGSRAAIGVRLFSYDGENPQVITCLLCEQLADALQTNMLRKSYRSTSALIAHMATKHGISVTVEECMGSVCAIKQREGGVA
jgi:hypothetical protein